MSTYIILSKLSPESLDDPSDIKAVAKEVSDRIKKDCPGVKWKQSFAVKGRFDIVDVVEADEEAQVDRAAMIIRSLGHADTETMKTTPWDEWLQEF